MNEEEQALGDFTNIFYRFFRIGWRGEEAPTGWYYQVEEWAPPAGPYESKAAAESSLKSLGNAS
jgi:hypothetical protein